MVDGMVAMGVSCVIFCMWSRSLRPAPLSEDPEDG